jgi:DnaJ-class molecular chaperone
MIRDDCYKLLEISSDADEKTIRKAYRERSKELHPDVNPSPLAAQQFATLSAACSTLLDPVSRLKHDDHFGYNKTTRNQDQNAKQKFSDFQKEKAEQLVSDWSNDYAKAMAMRDRQRNAKIEKHKAGMKRTQLLIVVIILVMLFGVTTFFVFRNYIFAMP